MISGIPETRLKLIALPADYQRIIKSEKVLDSPGGRPFNRGMQSQPFSHPLGENELYIRLFLTNGGGWKRRI